MMYSAMVKQGVASVVAARLEDIIADKHATTHQKKAFQIFVSCSAQKTSKTKNSRPYMGVYVFTSWMKENHLSQGTY